MEALPHEVTRLLQAWSGGEAAAFEKLVPLVHNELHRLAQRYMRREEAGHTLQTTALLHEAYLRLVEANAASWQSRVHFFAVSAQIMRRILVDFARAKHSDKRGGGEKRFPLDEVSVLSPQRDPELLVLDEALEKLAQLNPRQSRVVELRYFGGLQDSEIAEALSVSPRTVRQDWSLARLWLYRELRPERARDDT